MPDYDTLRVIWWGLLGTLLIGIAVMDGFDLGAAILLPFVGRSDVERRIVINTVGPVWEGNQVWLILGGGAIFAAWPPLYAVAFSGFYLAMLLLLAALILRPVGFKFRSKIEHATWRAVWDWALFFGGLVPALVFGVAFGNVLQGVPFSFDDTLRMTYEGSLIGLFNPFAVLCGLISVAMLTLHGAAYLVCKTEGEVRRRAQEAAMIASRLFVLLFIVAGVYTSFINGYVVDVRPGPNAASNPLAKTVSQHAGGLLKGDFQWGWISLALESSTMVFAVIAGVLLERGQRPAVSFVLSGLAVAGTIATAGLALYPFLLPSSVDPRASLTIFDASSSKMTLTLMTAVTAIFLPIILAYTTWVYRVLRGPVTEATIKDLGKTAY